MDTDISYWWPIVVDNWLVSCDHMVLLYMHLCNGCKNLTTQTTHLSRWLQSIGLWNIVSVSVLINSDFLMRNIKDVMGLLSQVRFLFRAFSCVYTRCVNIPIMNISIWSASNLEFRQKYYIVPSSLDRWSRSTIISLNKAVISIKIYYLYNMLVYLAWPDLYLVCSFQKWVSSFHSIIMQLVLTCQLWAWKTSYSFQNILYHEQCHHMIGWA